jgi:alpha-amylase
MKKFIFVVHNHQPVGNFDSVIREAFEKSYRPFINLVYELIYPKVCFHFSGILYDWLEKNEPSYLKKIEEMVKRDQIEILSSGYYEPVLGVIPERDRNAQIKKMNRYISNRFGFSPKGLWLTERVFNNTIPETLKDAGIKYTLVDDTHLLTSGIKEEEANSCFTTEYNGKKIYIFTINHNLRYMIPYKEPYKTVEYINKFNDGIFVMADDGEKFGLWPESYRLVYENRWLYNFFETLKNSGIEMAR